MSNNRNRNRSRGNTNAETSFEVYEQKKPFVYQGKRGKIIIPAHVEFDPDADQALALADAQKAGDELQAAGAMLGFIKSGFPDDIADGINLKLSELGDFTSKFMRYSGVNIPK